MDPKKARICELEFLELCTRLFAYRNNPIDITNFLITVKPFIDFNPRIMTELAKDIFNLKYKPSKDEKVLILHEKEFTLAEIGKLFNRSPASISLWLQKDIVLFPRSTTEQQTEVIKFMEQYNKVFTPDIRNIV